MDRTIVAALLAAMLSACGPATDAPSQPESVAASPAKASSADAPHLVCDPKCGWSDETSSDGQKIISKLDRENIAVTGIVMDFPSDNRTETACEMFGRGAKQIAQARHAGISEDAALDQAYAAGALTGNPGLVARLTKDIYEDEDLADMPPMTLQKAIVRVCEA